MKRQAILAAIVALCALALNAAVVVYSQSASLPKLADEEAKIAKMDWILLNTRVHALEQMLKDDLSAAFGPTSYSFAERPERSGSLFV